MPGLSPVRVALGELAVMVTGGPPFTGVAVKVYCSAASKHAAEWLARRQNYPMRKTAAVPHNTTCM